MFTGSLLHQLLTYFFPNVPKIDQNSRKIPNFIKHENLNILPWRDTIEIAMTEMRITLL